MSMPMHLAIVILASLNQAAASPPERAGLEHFLPDRRAEQAAYEDDLMARVDPASLRRWHDRYAAEVHRPGTPGDLAVIAKLTSDFTDMGLEVETFWFEAYLPAFIAAELEITAPDRTTLRLTEPPAPGDPSTAQRPEWPGWSGYAASGEAEGRIVYANYGRKQDFERLREWGVDCAGAVVIARFGGNYRGYKAKFAEEAGAAALLMYTDPQDAGYRRGLPYPEGGYANEHSIQRGSILTLDYPGDPLTPGEPAVDDAQRLDPAEVALPNIPVQPIGWGAAEEILSRMTGREVPGNAWQGGLPFRYRLTGGDDLRVRLKVEQDRRIVRTANVLGTLRGERFPEQRIVIGCHHDSWLHGASDPGAGVICVMESARAFAAAAAAGDRPERSITFALWGAEEQGIIGSTEWVEAYKDDLRENAVAYINLDMAAMGPNFGASAWPSLKQVIVDASRVVPQARDDELMVHDLWRARAGRDAEAPVVGTQGGGSDHVAFLCHVGVPTMSMGAHGSPGVSYHTAYDTLHWYRMIVGDDYEPAVMVTRMTNVVAARLAGADVIPYEPGRPWELFGDTLEAMADAAVEAGADAESVRAVSEGSARLGARLAEAQAARLSRLESASESSMGEADAIAIERWLTPIGPAPLHRPWYRNRLVAPDPTSGYGAWLLPGLRQALDGDGTGPDAATVIRDYQNMLAEAERRLEEDEK